MGRLYEFIQKRAGTFSACHELDDGQNLGFDFRLE